MGQGPVELSEGADGDSLDIFFSDLFFFHFFIPLWETAKYCLKGLLNPNQPTVRVTAVVMLFLRSVFSM